MSYFPEELTADGSQTFYSPEFGEWFHSRGGAYAEARQTYVQATNLVARAQTQGQIAVLDVCYGLSYNTAAALEALWQQESSCSLDLVALELDARVPQAAIAQRVLAQWPSSVQAALAALAHGEPLPPGLTGTLCVGDARQTIQPWVQTGWQADVIFLDPFSPPHCPQLWTVEFLHLVAQCLKPEGILATYSCAAAVRSALLQTGLRLGSSPGIGRQWPSTLATFSQKISLAPLSQQEQEHLETRAAVPYRDPSLVDEADTIQQRRQVEQAASPLKSTGAWRRRWF